MGFVAAHAVEPMDYNLAPYVEGPEATGRVPEPSQAAMNGYRKAVMALIREYKDVQEAAADPEGLSDADMDRLTERSEELERKMDQLTAKLCKNTPSVETLAKLPWRHKLMFSQWLQGQFDPNALKPATTK